MPAPAQTRSPATGRYIRTLDNIAHDHQAARLASQGVSEREIARQLGISPAAAHRAVWRGFQRPTYQVEQMLREQEQARVSAQIRSGMVRAGQLHDWLTARGVSVGWSTDEYPVTYQGDGDAIAVLDDPQIREWVREYVELQETELALGQHELRLYDYAPE